MTRLRREQRVELSAAENRIAEAHANAQAGAAPEAQELAKLQQALAAPKLAQSTYEGWGKVDAESLRREF